MRRACHVQAGFSLAEVVVALGLLAGVVISTAGLLVLGNRQVRSGRANSEAVAVARDILEELDGLGFHQIAPALGCVETNPTCTINSQDLPLPDPWQERLDETLTFGDPVADPDLRPLAEIVLESLAETGTPPNLEAARAIRITVEVRWREGTRARDVRLCTVRI